MKLPIIRLLWLLTATTASAATHAVLPGEAIQPKIDAAAPGDIIAIFGGTYPGDVTISKAVRLVEVDGQEVTITGNVIWNNVTNAPPFEGFTVGSSGKGITVTNTTGLVIKNVIASAGNGITTNGISSVSVLGGQCSAIGQNGGELSAWNVTVTGAFNVSVGSQKTVAVRCSFNTGNWNTLRGYLGYCDNLLTFTYSGSNGKIVIVGCRVNRQDHGSDALYVQGSNNQALVANCLITNVRWAHYTVYGGNLNYQPGRGIVIAGAGNRSLIYNNYIQLRQLTDGNYSTVYYDIDGGYGIRVNDTTSDICNNIIIGSNYGISAPFGVSASNNIVSSYVRGVSRDAVVLRNTISASPIFLASSDYVLQADSPGKDQGILDPAFNDFDGTRNDIGIWGGCLYDPQGRTTNKPMVISFDLAPQQLLKGVDTQVNISNGQAVAQP